VHRRKNRFTFNSITQEMFALRRDLIRQLCEQENMTDDRALVGVGASQRRTNAQDSFRYQLLIGIGAAVARRPLPHHRAYGSVHAGSRWLRRYSSTSEGRPSDLK
jgi:hypothetical protein